MIVIGRPIAQLPPGLPDAVARNYVISTDAGKLIGRRFVMLPGDSAPRVEYGPAECANS